VIPAGVQIFLALEPVDMRYGFERLAGLARERIGHDARSGAHSVARVGPTTPRAHARSREARVGGNGRRAPQWPDGRWST
jgi:hypothetical protein